ncbi:hypothetical protein BOX15_Mlig021386g1 [Macrostomum lignano]|uniref:Dynein heavy chain ATP-binding dynein motor region domain-containing protein n=1 Tax=Macrostomum lignano TaxID=282301 RepID=A0A267GWH1_9PLAT|nr:hypothetical protein BOX15_Mlig021386g1 [Macrostomum lignano]
MKIAAGKKKIKELEDEILRLLNEAQGSLLDDEQLVNTLQTSKSTSAEVTEQLAVSEKTEARLTRLARATVRYACLHFVLRHERHGQDRPDVPVLAGRLHQSLQAQHRPQSAKSAPRGANQQLERSPHLRRVQVHLPRPFREAQAAVLLPDDR